MQVGRVGEGDVEFFEILVRACGRIDIIHAHEDDITAFLVNLLLGQFKAGFSDQPIAHTNQPWNFLGMALSGLAFVLAGGCPGRQLFLAGEGDGDAAVFATGMIVGAGFAHNFSTASSAAGPGPFGPIAVIIGLTFCVVVGFAMREKIA